MAEFLILLFLSIELLFSILLLLSIIIFLFNPILLFEFWIISFSFFSLHTNFMSFIFGSLTELLNVVLFVVQVSLIVEYSLSVFILLVFLFSLSNIIFLSLFSQALFFLVFIPLFLQENNCILDSI